MRLSAATLLALALLTTGARAQELRDVPITGESLGGFVIPVEPVASDIVIEAVRGWAWDSDDTKRLQIEGDVRVRFGGYYFSAKDAVLWIDRIPSDQGLINQIAVYFAQAEEPTRRAGLGAAGKDLLVTGSTRGEITLSVTMLERTPAPPNPILSRGVARLKGHLESIARGALLKPRAEVDSPPVIVEPPLIVGESPTPTVAAPATAVTVRRSVDETQIFRPTQLAYGRAQRTYLGFAARHDLTSRPFAQPPDSPPSVGPKELVQRAMDSVAGADATVGTLQDSMMPVDVGDSELRAGLTEIRTLLAELGQRARDIVRSVGR